MSVVWRDGAAAATRLWLNVADEAELVAERIGHHGPLHLRGVVRVDAGYFDHAATQGDNLFDSTGNVFDTEIEVGPVFERGLWLRDELQQNGTGRDLTESD